MNTSDQVTLWAAGDVANCSALAGASATADVLAQNDGLILSLGDNAYPNGSIDDFLDCYDPTWGRVRDRIAPVIGNHEFHAAFAAPYFAYFCGRAGQPEKAYYSFDYGRWHIVVLNSVCGDDLDVEPEVVTRLGGCGSDSPQAQWLEQDLAAHPSSCTLAALHHPRFTSGDAHKDAVHTSTLFSILYDHDVDLVLSGHVHSYERFAPLAPDGTRDDAHGVREFVVGTGGAELYSLGSSVHENSEARDASSNGVLRLDLDPTGYRWQYVAAGASSFSDSGSGACH